MDSPEPFQLVRSPPLFLLGNVPKWFIIAGQYIANRRIVAVVINL